jgi:hypothetical protein
MIQQQLRDHQVRAVGTHRAPTRRCLP